MVDGAEGYLRCHVNSYREGDTRTRIRRIDDQRGGGGRSVYLSYVLTRALFHDIGVRQRADLPTKHK